MWAEWLTSWGFLVSEAANGVEAIERVEHEHPDLLLLDVSMPIMDGLEALRRLRSSAVTSALPVIMLSAQGSQASRLARESGCDIYLAKPVEPDTVIAHIRALLATHSGH